MLFSTIFIVFSSIKLVVLFFNIIFSSFSSLELLFSCVLFDIVDGVEIGSLLK